MNEGDLNKPLKRPGSRLRGSRDRAASGGAGGGAQLVSDSKYYLGAVKANMRGTDSSITAAGWELGRVQYTAPPEDSRVDVSAPRYLIVSLPKVNEDGASLAEPPNVELKHQTNAVVMTPKVPGKVQGQRVTGSVDAYKLKWGGRVKRG